jgi:CHASE3 domain sensor protein
MKPLVVTLFVFLAFGSCLFSGHYVFAQTDQTTSKLQAANTAIDGAFSAVLDAEKAGANVTALLAQLNVAEGDLAQAENSYRTGDSNTAATQADNVIPIAQEVTTTAQNAKQTALVSGQNAFWSNIALTVIGGFVFVLALFLVWRRFKRSYVKSLSEAKPEVNSQ